MNEIIKKENEAQSLEMLSAQRELYSKAKNIDLIEKIISVFTAVVFAFLTIIFPDIDWLRQITIIYVFLATILAPLLRKWSEGYKSLAVRIQQMFDLHIYNMQWEKLPIEDKPQYEEILRHKGNTDDDTLKNWYSPCIESVSHNNGVVLCMKENVSYDKSLKDRLIVAYVIGEILLVLLLLLVCLCGEKTFLTAMEMTIVPLVPCINWIISSHMKLLESRNEGENLRKDIQLQVEQAKTGCVKEEDLYRIQYKIYVHRLNSYSVPNWFYKLVRREEEKYSSSDTERLVKEM